ncbi:MAG: hypothetical protein FJX56_01850 [Alphaproteobacteria bacterium]|nr:hypothetical protein [Alphaproteobacteria bacterium]
MAIWLLRYWRGLAGHGRSHPRYVEFDPATLPDVWDTCFVIGHDGNGGVLNHVGPALHGVEIANTPQARLADVRPGSVLHGLLDRAELVAARGVPVLFRGVLATPARHLFRSVGLPFGDPAAGVQQVVCAVGFRSPSVRTA